MESNTETTTEVTKPKPKTLKEQIRGKFDKIVIPKAGEVQTKTLEETLKGIAAYCEKFTVGNGIDVKEKIDLGKKILSGVVKYRTGIESERKVIKKPYTDAGKLIDDEAKLYAAIIAPAEKAMQDKIKAAEDAEAKKKQDRAIARRTLLIETGFNFDGQMWIVGREMVMPSMLDDATDEDFAAIIERGKTEAERIAEEYATQQATLSALQEAEKKGEEVDAAAKEEAALAVEEAANAATPAFKDCPIRNIRWFMDRVGKTVNAYSENHYTGPMEIKQKDCVYLAEISQGDQGYRYEDVGGESEVKEPNFFERKFAASATTTQTPEPAVKPTQSGLEQTFKIQGYKEGYEKAIEEVLAVLTTKESVTRGILVQRVNDLLEIHRKTIHY